MANEIFNLNQNERIRSRTVLSWGSVVAGAFVAVGVFLTLSMLGAAVNISPQVMLRTGRMGAGRGSGPSA